MIKLGGRQIVILVGLSTHQTVIFGRDKVTVLVSAVVHQCFVLVTTWAVFKVLGAGALHS